MSNIEKKSKKIGIAVLAFFVVGVIMGITTSCFSDDDQNDTNVAREKDGSVETTKRPMIIWFHDLEKDPEILRSVISSGIFSHVMLEGVNQFDKPDYFVDPKFKRALELCKQNGVKVIWTRWLYPGHKVNNFRVEDAFDAQYYVQQIQQLRKEAKLMKADFVAFDAETYVKCPLKVIKNRKLSEKEFQKLNSAIKIAIEITGQVDFVLPSAVYRPRRLYNATQHLGKLIITEHTYLDIPERLNYARLNEDKVPYDIFGASVRITKENKEHPGHPRFTPREILKRQDLWAHKKGLFIFPGVSSNDITATALEFSRIRSTQSVHDSNDVH